MEKFQDIKLNFDTGDNWFYSKKFRDEIVDNLNTFKNNLVTVAEFKYPETDVANLFSQYGELINSLSNEFDTFKTKEKKIKSDFQQLIELRKNYSFKLLENMTVLISALTHMSGHNPDDLRVGGGGLTASKEMLSVLNKDNDFRGSKDSWIDALRGLIVTLDAQNEKLDQPLPFPEFKVNKMIFRIHRIWKSACTHELDWLLYNLSIKTSKLLNEKEYAELKQLLVRALDTAKVSINNAYNIYAKIDRTKIKKVFSKRHRDKVKNGRLDLIKQLKDAISELKTSLEKLGYKPEHQFLKFLEYLLEKCAKDQKHIGESDDSKK